MRPLRHCPSKGQHRADYNGIVIGFMPAGQPNLQTIWNRI